MPFTLDEMQHAYLEFKKFQNRNSRRYHDRYIFPLFAGTYFTYRKIDVLRIVQIAKAISHDPKYLDVGCGYGDFLKKVREYLRNAIGIEKELAIFYLLETPRPDYIYPSAIEWLTGKRFDIAFVGWMDRGVDFRRFVADAVKCVVTTFDSGGQCGVNGACDYEEFGFKRIAWWKTPSWLDVNTELMNKYYTQSIKTDEMNKHYLSTLRTCQNLWYLYTKPELSDQVTAAFKQWLIGEQQAFIAQKFDFETILDECGFHYMQHLPTSSPEDRRLWEVAFDD